MLLNESSLRREENPDSGDSWFSRNSREDRDYLAMWTSVAPPVPDPNSLLRSYSYVCIELLSTLKSITILQSRHTFSFPHNFDSSYIFLSCLRYCWILVLYSVNINLLFIIYLLGVSHFLRCLFCLSSLIFISAVSPENQEHPISVTSMYLSPRD